jgi:hypothetical protein
LQQCDDIRGRALRCLSLHSSVCVVTPWYEYYIQIVSVIDVVVSGVRLCVGRVLKRLLLHRSAEDA